jgi:hypothetical protein
MITAWSKQAFAVQHWLHPFARIGLRVRSQEQRFPLPDRKTPLPQARSAGSCILPRRT